ncbi:MAG: UvrD-helicase domain-containing protein, partial [Oscillospiraceae bacterium]|nr:UvrD-helicase domain-containing protein [Oscillospiraceae bacterium]
LRSARICTIHSFWFELIRENAENCGVSPMFTIAEPAQERIYQQRALQSVMERWSKKTADMELLFSHFCAREDTELETVILEIADYMDTLPFRDAWIRQAAVLSADGDSLLEKYRTAFCEGAEELLLLMEQAKSLAMAVLPDSRENRYLDKIQEDVTLLHAQMEDVRTVPAEQLLENPLKSVIGFSAFPRKNKKENADEEARTALQKLRDLYKAQYKDRLVKAYLEPLRYFQEDTAVQQKLIPLLLSLTDEYLTALFQEKQRQNVLSFSDAEELALGLLGTVDEEGRLHKTELAETLSQQISLIMVDEYQDSNNKQDCLFKLLSRDSTIQEDGLHYGTNAFLVGDVKQSIYSFRQANPENFRRAIVESTPLADCKHTEMALIYLNQNFRSAPGVLDFVNSLFGTLMTVQCGEVQYDDNERLNFGLQVY